MSDSFLSQDEIDALLERIIHLRMAIGLAVLQAPGHGPQADLGHLDIGAAQPVHLHGVISPMPEIGGTLRGWVSIGKGRWNSGGGPRRSDKKLSPRLNLGG